MQLIDRVPLREVASGGDQVTQVCPPSLGGDPLGAAKDENEMLPQGRAELLFKKSSTGSSLVV